MDATFINRHELARMWFVWMVGIQSATRALWLRLGRGHGLV